MTTNGRQTPEDKMIDMLERLAQGLERVILWLSISAGLLALIAFIIILRTMIGR